MKISTTLIRRPFHNRRYQREPKASFFRLSPYTHDERRSSPATFLKDKVSFILVYSSILRICRAILVLPSLHSVLSFVHQMELGKLRMDRLG